MTTIADISGQDFDTEVLDSDRPVLVDFWADWCHPCHLIAPHVKSIAEEHADRLKVVKLDLDANPQVAARYQVMSIPTLMLFVDGVEKARLIGARPKEAILSEITKFLDGN